uniref:Uncharacterized protein n=1 Tax=Anguilla anguilla TaxID=7936 RepID=A0A0E9QPJ4_ANGAN
MSFQRTLIYFRIDGKNVHFALIESVIFISMNKIKIRNKDFHSFYLVEQ